MFLAAQKIKKVIFLVSVLLLAGLVGFLLFSDKSDLGQVKAEDSHNVSGFVWSENIGWISLNCNNTELSQPRCKQDNDYGVHIEESGNLTGYGWSENIGWIHFDPSGPYPSSPNYSVQVHLETGELTGWARGLAYGGGWDGWVSMRGTSPDYGVDIDTRTGDFSGWAWGSDLIGWIHFAGANYKAQTTFPFNHDPTVGNLSVNQGDYCVLAFHPRFYWDFSDEDDGDFQNAYQVQIDDDADIGDNPLIDSCNPDPGTCASGSTAESYTPASPSSFTYNTTYYWRVKVWDDKGGMSGWAQGQFTTPQHAYPEPIFTWLPQRPSKGEFTQFCAVQEPDVCQSDVSQCYNNLGQLISCSGASFQWTFPSGTEFSTITTAVSKNPEVKFPEKGWQVVSLNINDGVGSCSTTTNIRISVPLPKWKEVAP